MSGDFFDDEERKTPAAGATDPLTDSVAAQYERWVYPMPTADLAGLRDKALKSGFMHLRELYWMLWPALAFRDDLKILIAGCGTDAAAWYAYLYPHARVVGIDVSAASLANANRLKAAHGLANLALHQLPIERAESLGETFDFISAGGVVHHLADPVGGLRVLGSLLEVDGVVDVMVYARYGHAGVYMFQELFRLLGLGQTPEDLETVKGALLDLNPNHPLQVYVQGNKELHYDGALVDTFLHPRDRAYTVADCLDLVRQAGLVFQGWDENVYYHPDGTTFKSESLRQKLGMLRGAEVWQAMELINGHLVKHRFYACRRQRDERTYRIQFDNDEFLEYVPIVRGDSELAPGSGERKRIHLSRPLHPRVLLSDLQTAVCSRIDGIRTVRACVQAAGIDASLPSSTEFAREFFGTLWRTGFMIFRIVRV